MEKRIVNACTKDGFKCKIDLNVIEDYCFLKLLRQTADDGTKFVDAVQMILGEAGEEKLIKHLQKTGRGTSVAVIGEALNEILLSTKETKN